MSITIRPINGTEMRLVPGDWPMPAALRNAVGDEWARMKAEKPGIWDGRILGFSDVRIGEDGILRAGAREDAYSAFLTWRNAGFPDFGLVHAFGTALIISRDGALIMGVMGGDTVNAGRVYPPGGSLEPRDVQADGLVDAEACIAIELDEETGLKIGDARLGPLLAIEHGQKLSIARVLHFDMDADALVATIRVDLGRQEHRELENVVACRSPEDGHRAGELLDYAEALLAALANGRLLSL